jgi:tetraacyldisaccharide-1-P 4'-kinase
MTEKDAVKLGVEQTDRFWYVPVDLCFAADTEDWLDDIEIALRSHSGPAGDANRRPGEQTTL